jgi:hypothetical protein
VIARPAAVSRSGTAADDHHGHQASLDVRVRHGCAPYGDGPIFVLIGLGIGPLLMRHDVGAISEVMVAVLANISLDWR